MIIWTELDYSLNQLHIQYLRADKLKSSDMDHNPCSDLSHFK